jgi:hypothetical protein
MTSFTQCPGTLQRAVEEGARESIESEVGDAVFIIAAVKKSFWKVYD